LQTADHTYYRRLDGTTGRPRLTSSPSPADAILTGTPSDLLLTLWCRVNTTTLTGNPTALTAWQQAIDG
jgi:hypothetical protein